MAYQEDFPIDLSYSQAGVPTILLPPFWSHRPRAWLARAEQAFIAYNTSPESHLPLTLASLPMENFLAVHWALSGALHSKSPYEVFKMVLINTFGKNESYCIANRAPAASTTSSTEAR